MTIIRLLYCPDGLGLVLKLASEIDARDKVGAAVQYIYKIHIHHLRIDSCPGLMQLQHLRAKLGICGYLSQSHLTQCLLPYARKQQRKSWKQGQNINLFNSNIKAVEQNKAFLITS